jgi:rubrerythrin
MASGAYKTWTKERILDMALRKERDAFRFYDGLLNQTRADILREVLETLRNEEAKHVQLIERAIAEMHLGRG